MDDIYSFGLLYTWVAFYSFGLDCTLMDIYSSDVIVPGWHLFIWCYCTSVAFIHFDLLYMCGTYLVGHNLHLVAFIRLDILYMGGGLIVHG